MTTTTKTILIVDDEPAICGGLKQIAEHLEFQVIIAYSAEQALVEVAAHHIDIVAIDVRLPGLSGLEAISSLRKHVGENAPFIIMTAYGDLQTAVDSARQGVLEYLIKPFDRATFIQSIKRAVDALVGTENPAIHSASGSEMLGQSRVMRQIFNDIALAANSSAHVLIEGESGTGKELVARAIHQYSQHASGPLVTVHIASFNPNLIESELFGHARGAFTGAESDRIGWLQQADGTNLFLDEVAEIPLNVQAKLLRALDQGEIMPVGSSREIRCRFRIISASHHNLFDLSRQGKFRQDLFFRLAGYHIRLPPLREREDDVCLLAQYFLDRWNRLNQTQASLTAAAVADLTSRSWPGNIRELKHVIERAAILARGHSIEVAHLPGPLPAPIERVSGQEDLLQTTLVEQLKRWADQQLANPESHGRIHEMMLDLMEPPVFRTTLERCNGHVSRAARLLGLHRTTLKRRLHHM